MTVPAVGNETGRKLCYRMPVKGAGRHFGAPSDTQTGNQDRMERNSVNSGKPSKKRSSEAIVD